MKHKNILSGVFFFFFSLKILAGGFYYPAKLKEKENPAFKSKKVTIHIKTHSIDCPSAMSARILSEDSDISPFFNFNIVVKEKDKSGGQIKSFISYDGTFLGTIYGAPTKQFLLSLQPIFEQMIKDQRIIFRGERISSIIQQ